MPKRDSIASNSYKYGSISVKYRFFFVFSLFPSVFRFSGFSPKVTSSISVFKKHRFFSVYRKTASPYYSILQYITATSRQYGYQPGVPVVYYSILQYITATSRQYGYQPGMSVVYYSILQNITATSRGYLTVIIIYQ